jgi:hypothetical protein
MLFALVAMLLRRADQNTNHHACIQPMNHTATTIIINGW